MKTFSIKEALNWGWKEFKARPWFYVGISLVVFAVSGIVSLLVKNTGDAFGGIVQIVGTLVQWWLYIGVVLILLAVYKKQTPNFEMLFSAGGKTFGNYILGTIAYGLIVLVGTILLIVPGIIWGIKYHYYSFLIIEKKMKPIDALKKSGAITMGYKWQLFGFLIVVGLLNLLGALVLVVGLLVSVPVTLLASVWVYKWIEGQVRSVAPEQGPDLAPQQ